MKSWGLWAGCALIVACACLFAWASTLQSDLAGLRAENQLLDRNWQISQRQIYAAAQAQAVAAQFRSDQAARDAKFIENSQTIEGIPDAPLHPDLADLINGL
ncbi:MAG: hypothetical protein ACSHX3_16810 [Litorimonas sp.]